MATKVIVGLAVLAALVEGLAPGIVPNALLPLALVILGLAYAYMAIDAEDATAYLVVAVAAAAAASADVLGNVQVIGGYLDAILDQLVVALLSGVVTVVVVRTINRLKD